MILKIIVNIELISFEDSHKPVVFSGKVYQVCVRDQDNDCILKDNMNGVHIINNAFSGDEMYDSELIEKLSHHPFNEVKQIKYHNQIIGGNTVKLQSLIDLYYGN